MIGTDTIPEGEFSYLTPFFTNQETRFQIVSSPLTFMLMTGCYEQAPLRTELKKFYTTKLFRRVQAKLKTDQTPESYEGFVADECIGCYFLGSTFFFLQGAHLINRSPRLDVSELDLLGCENGEIGDVVPGAKNFFGVVPIFAEFDFADYADPRKPLSSDETHRVNQQIKREILVPELKRTVQRYVIPGDRICMGDANHALITHPNTQVKKPVSFGVAYMAVSFFS